MPLQNTGQILLTAQQEGYCVGAFNFVDYLTMEAVVTAASRAHSPVILQASSGTVLRYGTRTLVGWAQNLADQTAAPIGLHLDHGTDLDLIQTCIAAGFTSVMIDASSYPFDENVARTRQVVDAAHRQGVAVEGEIGILGGVEDDLAVSSEQAVYTTPEEAIAFQSQSGVDFLAVAIGTAHGFYKVAPRLDLDTLRRLHAQVSFPLVIHGGTGLPEATLQALVAAGATKVNVSTQLKKTYIDALKTYLRAHPGEYNPLMLFNSAFDCLVELVTGYLQTFGSHERV